MIAHVVVKMPDPMGQLLAMFQYLLTVLAAEFTHFFVTMPVLFWIFTRTNPYKHMYGCVKAFGMAFASNNRSNCALNILCYFSEILVANLIYCHKLIITKSLFKF